MQRLFKEKQSLQGVLLGLSSGAIGSSAQLSSTLSRTGGLTHGQCLGLTVGSSGGNLCTVCLYSTVLFKTDTRVLSRPKYEIVMSFDTVMKFKRLKLGYCCNQVVELLGAQLNFTLYKTE